MDECISLLPSPHQSLSLGNSACLVITFSCFSGLTDTNLKFILWLRPIVLTKYGGGSCTVVRKPRKR